MGQIGVREIENGPLHRWLDHLGVSVRGEMVEDDRNAPYVIPHRQRVGAIEIETLEEVPYPWFVEAAGDGLASDHPAVSRLEGIALYWASPVELGGREAGEEAAGSGPEATELVRSSPRSWTSPSTVVMPPASVLESEGGARRWYAIPRETERHTLAAALVGSFESYFAEHAPPGEEAPEDETGVESAEEGGDEETADAAEDGGESEGAAPESESDAPRKAFLTRSPETRLVVIGDAELFSERTASMTARTQAEFEGNLVFAQNLVDWAVLDNDMIQIRSRGATARPLDLERYPPGWVEGLAYAVPCALVLLIGMVRFVRRRNRKPVALEPAR
jgi:hypothetical protein